MPSISRLQAVKARRLVWALSALMLLVAWVSVAVVLRTKRTDAIEAEVRQNTNLARAFEEQTARVLATTDQAIKRLRDAVATGRNVAPELVRYANETGLAPAILVQLSLIDATGHFVGSNLDPDGEKTGHVDLSSREHIKVHLAKAASPPGGAASAGPAPQPLPARDDLFIGKPVLGKVSGKWTIQLSRRIASADGSPLGVVVASLDPAYFEDVFRRVSLGALGGVGLVGKDLTIRARVIGGKSSGLGSTGSPDGAFARAIAVAEGHYSGASTLDGVARIGAFRQVSGFPLYLLVITSEDEALADWRATRNVTLVLASLLTVAVLLGSAGLLFSIRRMEQSNEALRLSESRANAANQAKTEFLAAISHELRTPLTSIRGFAELMEHRLDSPKFREQAGLIRKGAEHLNELLTQILDLAKVEAGAMPMAREPVALRPLIQGTIDFFALTAANKGLALGSTVADDVPAQIDCDGLRLKQVLNNLLSNALKFTREGSVTLSVERRGRCIAFHVLDTGPGIPPELHETIFERFRQANARISHEHGGTGLGLALSRGLAELMHGSLTVSSAPGQGSRFTLELPSD